MNKFTTRSAAIAFLIAAGKPEAMAKVAVKETFDRSPDGVHDDLLRNDDGSITDVEEGELKTTYDHFVANQFDADEKGIYVYDELKYDLNGDLLAADHIESCFDEPAPDAANDAGDKPNEAEGKTQ